MDMYGRKTDMERIEKGGNSTGDYGMDCEMIVFEN